MLLFYTTQKVYTKLGIVSHNMGVSKQSQRETMMLTQPLSRLIPRMAIPTIIAFLINSVYSLADTYFVSSLGTGATAAVSVNAALDQIIMMTGSMLAVGANSYIARLLGAQQKERASRVLSTTFFLAFGLGALLLTLGMGFMKPLVRMLGATATCEQHSIDYATYILLAAPFMASSFVMNQCLRAEGSALLSMVGMGFGGILNCVLDPIFIFGLDLGVAGASMATAISKFVSFIILLFPYVTHRSILGLTIRNFCFAKDIIIEVVSIGFPSLIRSGLSVIAGILLNNIAGGISDSVLAGIGVSTKIMMFPFSIILGFGTGFQPVVGFNWGAKRNDRVIDSYRFAAKVAIIGAVIMALGLAFFAHPLISLFSEADPAMKEVGAFCIRLQCIALPVHAWVAVVNMLCAGLGYAQKAFILATARQGTCFLPFIYPLSYFGGAYGLCSVQAIADMLTLIPAVLIIMELLREIRQMKEDKL